MRWFKSVKKDPPPLPYEGKIEVFSRHCISSSVSRHKKRPPEFSHEKCHKNLLDTIDFEKANLTCFLDIAHGDSKTHFLEHAILIHEGTESGAFLRMLDHVLKLPLHPETLCYFLEDDYLHKSGWVQVLIEGFQVPNAEYVTLYDHRDKYFFPMYNRLQTQLFVTPSCHWRSSPSTTQTFATRFKTLQRDMKIHRKYSEGRKISDDHAKFLELQKRGSMLISSIPGFSTHAEPEYASPCFHWDSLLIRNLEST